MFWTRLISGIVLVILALITVISGGTVLWATALLISLIGLQEIYRALSIEKKSLLNGAGILAALAYYGTLLFAGDANTILCLFLIFLFVLLGIYVFCFPKYQTEQIMAAFFGFFYVCVTLSYLYQTRILPDGAYTVWLIFICAWGNDTFAYCAGVLFGKHKMAPVLSPKKSVEGLVGGILGAAVLGAIYAAVVGKHLTAEGNVILSYALVCAVGAAFSVIGDLAASAIKRNHGIKDYGKLIPGHGGILDRFDSIIFTAPAIYFLAASLIH